MYTDNFRATGRLVAPFVLVALLMISSAVLAPVLGDWDLHSVDTNLTGAKSVFAADMNDDDVPDLVATGSTNHEVFWYEAPLWTKHAIDDSLGGAQDVFVAFVNNDTIPDVVATGLSADDVVWYEGPTWIKHYIDAEFDGAKNLFVIDLDGDLDVDVVATGRAADELAWYENDNLTWTKHTIDATLDYAEAVYVADLNGDDDLDIVATSYGTGSVYWYEGPSFTRRIVASAQVGPMSVFVADVNGDDIPDIIGTEQDISDVVWYEGPGPLWYKHTIDNDLYSAREVVAEDMDGDEDLDIVASGYLADDVVWYEAPFWTKHAVDSNLDGAYGIVVHDMDGDLGPDVVAVGQQGGDVNWYENPNSSVNVYIIPNPVQISLADENGGDYSDSFVCYYLGGGSGGVYGYSIDVEWDNTVVSASNFDFQRPDTGPFASAILFQVTTKASDGNGIYRVQIDAALGGGGSGTFGEDELFKGLFTAVGAPAYATSNLNLILNEFRDNLNQTLSGFTALDGLVLVDLINPSVVGVAIANQTLAHTDDFIKDTDDAQVTVTVVDANPAFSLANIEADLSGLGGGAAVNPDSYVANVATWTLPGVVLTPSDGTVTVTVTATDPETNQTVNSGTITADNTKPTAFTGMTILPGHQTISLSWDDPSTYDLNYDGVVIQYNNWGNYPAYAYDGGPADPGFPQGEAEGTNLYTGTDLLVDHTFVTPARDIYSYAGFVYDIARNYSDPEVSGDNEGRATNYWLADVVPNTAWDGFVSTADISALGATYYQYTNNQCDVGPTNNGSPRGIPVPDGTIGFDDLMIFALNYGVVSPIQAPPAFSDDMIAGAGVGMNLELPEAISTGSEFVATVMLEDEDAIVKGARFVVTFDASVVEYLGVQKGALLNSLDTFFKEVSTNGSPDLHMAALGAGMTFGGSGELVQLRFRLISSGDMMLKLENLIARDVGNNDLMPMTTDVITPSSTGIPTHVYLKANMPNPFGRSTSIVFGMPKAGSAQLAIYDTSGRLVRTLVDGSLPAGEYNYTWDRRSAAGNPVSSGLYFYQLSTSGRTVTHKMVVVE
ncbi:MAG: VCBS repeat-containing protein [Candidatus Eisenbacteria bacterium]|uniref:VCBS repeat-containing protein n=1 Tax=Eiseniibacteriota bacterium TaxID=2212470 RepID=A0A948S2L9_UNCEI|nr:VCBS repeat-containing protein [Candidatus Eisenbacteria bacterium]MBU1949055.1 VCBS repeat-containing protein [Candidatus Eisenbacteria bacterium]MBU2692689.1 VCBS repeat-containing protein [Candidatus Eisenbacteria bacterium]